MAVSGSGCPHPPGRDCRSSVTRPGYPTPSVRVACTVSQATRTFVYPPSGRYAGTHLQAEEPNRHRLVTFAGPGGPDSLVRQLGERGSVRFCNTGPDVVVTTNLLPSRDKFHIGLSFQVSTSIAQPGPGPFILTSSVFIPRTETTAWGVFIKTYLNQPPWTIQLGEGLLGSRLAARTETQAVEDDPARFSVEIRGDTGQILDQGEQTLPWTWLPTIAKGVGLLEGRLIQMQQGNSSVSADLQSIIDAVYQRFPHA